MNPLLIFCLLACLPYFSHQTLYIPPAFHFDNQVVCGVKHLNFMGGMHSSITHSTLVVPDKDAILASNGEDILIAHDYLYFGSPYFEDCGALGIFREAVR